MKGTIHALSQGTPEWHELRRTRVTASEIYDVLHSPERALRQQIEKRLGRPSFTGNDATRYGQDAEPVAISDFEATHNVVVKRVGFVSHAEHGELIGCSPDGLYTDEEGYQVLLQVKCPFSKALPASPDQRHVEQVNFEMGVTGLDRCVLYYWTPDRSAEFLIRFDHSLWTEQRDAALHLQNEVRKVEYLGAEQWLESQQKLVTLRYDPSWTEAAHRYYSARVAFEEAQEEFEAAKKELLFLADNLDTRGAGVKVTWLERTGTVAWPLLVKKYGIPKEEVEAARSAPTRYGRVEVDRGDE